MLNFPDLARPEGGAPKPKEGGGGEGVLVKIEV